jgi:hypothetical protein
MSEKAFVTSSHEKAFMTSSQRQRPQPITAKFTVDSLQVPIYYLFLYLKA